MWSLRFFFVAPPKKKCLPQFVPPQQHFFATNYICLHAKEVAPDSLRSLFSSFTPPPWALSACFSVSPLLPVDLSRRKNTRLPVWLYEIVDFQAERWEEQRAEEARPRHGTRGPNCDGVTSSAAALCTPLVCVSFVIVLQRGGVCFGRSSGRRRRESSCRTEIKLNKCVW